MKEIEIKLCYDAVLKSWEVIGGNGLDKLNMYHGEVSLIKPIEVDLVMLEDILQGCGFSSNGIDELISKIKIGD